MMRPPQAAEAATLHQKYGARTCVRAETGRDVKTPPLTLLLVGWASSRQLGTAGKVGGAQREEACAHKARSNLICLQSEPN
jgi:hypothetical protein